MTFFPFDAFDSRLYKEDTLVETFQPTPEGIAFRLKLVLNYLEEGDTESGILELKTMLAAMERLNK
ncbi:MAG: hypothetical protein WCO84_06070 [bacterium]